MLHPWIQVAQCHRRGSTTRWSRRSTDFLEKSPRTSPVPSSISREIIVVRVNHGEDFPRKSVDVEEGVAFEDQKA